MKVFISVIVIIVGILLFKIGNNMLTQITQDKKQFISEEEFWDMNIDSFNFSPNYFFNSIPEQEIYKTDGLIYFKTVLTYFKNNRAIIKNEIIQNNNVLFINTYTFDISKYPKLLNINTNEVLTGYIKNIEKAEEIKSIMMLYKGFIDLWVLYNTK